MKKKNNKIAVWIIWIYTAQWGNTVSSEALEEYTNPLKWCSI